MINSRVKKIRVLEDLSQVEFAKKINLTKDHLSRIERGKRNVTDKNINLICKTFNVNELWLTTGEGDMYVDIADNFDTTEEIKDIVRMISCFENDDRELAKEMITALYNKVQKNKE